MITVERIRGLWSQAYDGAGIELDAIIAFTRLIEQEHRDQVLEAVADGVLDALREKDAPHLTLGLKLEIANKARRAVAGKLDATLAPQG